MSKYEFCNAFQPSKEDFDKRNELAKRYKYRTWVPESVIVAGDTYVFYSDVEDLRDFGMGLYEHVKQVGNHRGYTCLNIVENTSVNEDFTENELSVLKKMPLWELAQTLEDALVVSQTVDGETTNSFEFLKNLLSTVNTKEG